MVEQVIELVARLTDQASAPARQLSDTLKTLNDQVITQARAAGVATRDAMAIAKASNEALAKAVDKSFTQIQDKVVNKGAYEHIANEITKTQRIIDDFGKITETNIYKAMQGVEEEYGHLLNTPAAIAARNVASVNKVLDSNKASLWSWGDAMKGAWNKFGEGIKGVWNLSRWALGSILYWLKRVSVATGLTFGGLAFGFHRWAAGKYQEQQQAMGSGIDPQVYRSLLYAGERAGVSGSQMGTAINTFVRNLGELKTDQTGPLAAFLKDNDPGLMQRLLESTSEQDALMMYLEEMSRREPAGAKAGAQAAFGIGGQFMNILTQDQKLREALERYSTLRPGLTKEQMEQIDRYNKLMIDMKTSWGGLVDAMAGPVLKPLNEQLNRLVTWMSSPEIRAKLSKWVQDLIDYTEGWVEYLQSDEFQSAWKPIQDEIIKTSGLIMQLINDVGALGTALWDAFNIGGILGSVWDELKKIIAAIHILAEATRHGIGSPEVGKAAENYWRMFDRSYWTDEMKKKYGAGPEGQFLYKPNEYPPGTKLVPDPETGMMVPQSALKQTSPLAGTGTLLGGPQSPGEFWSGVPGTVWDMVKPLLGKTSGAAYDEAARSGLVKGGFGGDSGIRARNLWSDMLGGPSGAASGMIQYKYPTPIALPRSPIPPGFFGGAGGPPPISSPIPKRAVPLDALRSKLDQIMQEPAKQAANAPIGGIPPTGITIQARGPSVNVTQAPPNVNIAVSVNVMKADDAPAATATAIGNALGNQAARSMHDRPTEV